MATMDIISSRRGGQPIFLTSEARERTTSDEGSDYPFRSQRERNPRQHFRGIARCSTIAAAIVAAANRRLQTFRSSSAWKGPRSKKAKKSFAKSGVKLTTADDLTDATKRSSGCKGIAIFHRANDDRQMSMPGKLQVAFGKCRTC